MRTSSCLLTLANRATAPMPMLLPAATEAGCVLQSTGSQAATSVKKSTHTASVSSGHQLAARVASGSTCCTSGRSVVGPLNRGFAFQHSSPLSDIASLRSYSAKPFVAPINVKAIVGHNSPLAASYLKNIHPARLTDRIGRRKTVKEVQDMARIYQHKLDGIGLAAVITKLRKLQKQDRSSSPEMIASTLEILWPVLDVQLRFYSIRTVSTILWALARLGAPGVSADRVAQLFEKGSLRMAKAYEVQPRRLVILVWAASRLLPTTHHQDPRVLTSLNKISRVLRPKLHQLTPQGLSNLAIGLTGLGFKDQQFIHSILEEAASRIGNMAVDQLQVRDYVGLLTAMKSSGTGHMGFLEKSAVTLQQQLGCYRPQDVVSIVDAFAAVKVKHKDLLNAAAEAAVKQLSLLDEASKERLLHSMQALQFEHEQLKAAMAASGKSQSS